MHPETYLDGTLDALLRRLAQSEATKWQALKELGLNPPPGSKGR